MSAYDTFLNACILFAMKVHEKDPNRVVEFRCGSDFGGHIKGGVYFVPLVTLTIPSPERMNELDGGFVRFVVDPKVPADHFSMTVVR